MESSLKTVNSWLKKRFLGSFEPAISSSPSLCPAALSGGSSDLVQSTQDLPSGQPCVLPNRRACPPQVRNAGSIPVSGRSPGGKYGNPLQYSCLKNPRRRGAWRATVHRVTKSQTRLSTVHKTCVNNLTYFPVHRLRCPYSSTEKP